jgi:hypothetical protein
MRRVSNVLLTTALAAVTSGLALGCGSGGTGAPAGATDLPEDFTGPGVYTVPAVPAAQFPIATVKIEQEDDGVSLYYELPADLAGEPVHVELHGKLDGAGSLQLSGAMGTSTCTVSPGQIVCDEHLSGLRGEPTSPKLPPAGPQRTAAQSFITDPIGRLTVVLPM